MYEKIVLILMTVTAAIFLGFAVVVLKSVWSTDLRALICELDKDGKDFKTYDELEVRAKGIGPSSIDALRNYEFRGKKIVRLTGETRYED